MRLINCVLAQTDDVGKWGGAYVLTFDYRLPGRDRIFIVLSFYVRAY